MSSTGSNNTNGPFNFSDITANLPSLEERVGMVNALKSKLQSLGGAKGDVLESLTPSVRKRVEKLKELQSQHDELEAKFFEERAALEAKYQKLYEPNYTKRYEIVNGIVEVEGVTTDSSMDQGGDNAPEGNRDLPNAIFCLIF
ncbi:hypothetical protein Droror1_Dr00013462 [Drosera rotundifolia]